MPKTSLRTLSFALGVGRMGTWELDLEHLSLTCSAAFKTICGIPSGQEFTYQQLLQAIHPNDRERWHSAINNAVQSSSEFELEYRIYWPDGTQHWILIHGGHVDLENAQKSLLVGVSLDVTERKRGEEELRLSEERHRALTAASAQIVWVTDADGYGLGDQSSWEGFTGDRDSRSRWLQAIHADDRAATIHKWQEAFTTGTAYEIEHRVRRYDGVYRLMQARGVPVRDVQGNIREWIGTHTDITERRNAENQLRDAQARLSLAMQSSGTGMFDWDMVRQTIVWSPEILQLYGMKEGEFGGRYENWLECVLPEDRERANASIQAAMQTGKYNLEFRLRRRNDGEIRWANGRGVVSYDETGRPVRMLGINMDITERKEAEQALEQNEELFRLTFENAAVGIAHVGLDGRWLRINPRMTEITGFTSEQLLATDFQSITHPDDVKEDLEHVKRLLAGEIKKYRIEKRYRRKDGSTVWVDLFVSLLRKEDGSHDHFLSIVTDITARKEAEQAIQRSREELEQNVRDRTWELASANASLRELSGRLLQLQDNERRKFARDLHDSVGQLVAALSMNVGAIASNSDPADLKLQQLHRDSQELLQQISKEIRTLSHLLHPPLLDEIGLLSALRWYTDGFTQRSGIVTSLELPNDMPRMSADLEIAIFRVVQECLTNSHRHSGSSSVTVRLSRVASELQVEVEDNGSGIPDEKLKEFESTGLSGVGLRGMRERLRQLGGSLEIFSSTSGTTVRGKAPVQTVLQMDLSLPA
jgi:two-component system sensor histidine kinase UhpB